jgi:hypothetical protein
MAAVAVMPLCVRTPVNVLPSALTLQVQVIPPAFRVSLSPETCQVSGVVVPPNTYWDVASVEARDWMINADGAA